MKLLLLAFMASAFTLGCNAQGLQFQGNDKLIEERTSYSVFENKIPSFSNTFLIKFDVSVLRLDGFGYIFRLIDDHTRQTYNFTYTHKDSENSSFKFSAEGKDNLISADIPDNLMGHHRWLPVSLTFLLEQRSLLILINDKEYRIDNLDLPKRLTPHIYFGQSEHIVDVPVFAIRNLEVKDSNKEYKFPLRESSGEDVHDSKGAVTGHVSDPVWLINTAYYWKFRYEYKSNIVSGINYNESKQNMIFFNSDSLSSFDLATNLQTVRKYINSLPVDMRLGTNFIDEINNRLYVYEVNNLPIGNTTVAFLKDADSIEWIPVSSEYLQMQLHHHDGYFDADNNRYIVFGGFGNRRYNKEFLSLDIEKNKWDTLSFSGDNITPRYFSGMAYYKEKNLLYIFGGMGNESADHTIGRNYLYDLYRVDLAKRKTTKLWSLSWQQENIVPARNMIMFSDTCFYALCYPEHKPATSLQLYRFSIQDGSYHILGNSIPINSEKITTNANLYYNRELKEFYCTVQEFQDDGSSLTRLYSLSAPPISKSELEIYGVQDSDFGYWFWLTLILLVAGLGLVYIIYVCQKTEKKHKKKDRGPFINERMDITAQPEIRAEDKANSIYLFGDFAVYDKKGRDITYMFSVRLKHAFLLILQYSLENGISSQQFSETLWPDRSEFNVKNLRNVTLNHLRKILLELNDIELVFDKGYFKITMKDECYCDYIRFFQLVYSDKSPDSVNEIIKILLRGRFLKSADEQSFNSFSEKVENNILSLLPIDMENAYERHDYPLVIQLSDVLFISEPLNEKALYYQINSLHQLKLTDEAKKKYTLFIIEYKNKKRQDYPQSFSSMIKETK